jgi:hypothetical protein
MNPPPEKSSTPPPCRHLRTKKMYIPALAEASAEASHRDQSFYWCNRTLGALGADDNQVHPCVCQPGRSCHEA